MVAPDNKVQSSTDNPDWIVLGEISGVYGVKGWVKVFSYTDPREAITLYKTWYLQKRGQWQAVKVLNGRKQGKSVVAQLEDLTDRDQAMLLRGTKIAIKPEQLANLPQGEYYWKDLIGLRVINQDGIDLGIVDAMMETGANDVMVVVDENDNHERLIPFTQGPVEAGNKVLKVDLAAGQIRVDWDADF